jgi:hypothetical protein
MTKKTAHVDDTEAPAKAEAPDAPLVRMKQIVRRIEAGALHVYDKGGVYPMPRDVASNLVIAGHATPVDDIDLANLVPVFVEPVKVRMRTSDPEPPPPNPGQPVRLSSRDGEHVRPGRVSDVVTTKE